MRKLILVRHAQPVVSPTIDSREWQLSADGKRQSEQLAKALRDHDPMMVLTSVEPKAVQTGAIIAQDLGLQMETAKDLHEHDRRGVPFFSDKGSFQDLVTSLFELQEVASYFSGPADYYLS